MRRDLVSDERIRLVPFEVWFGIGKKESRGRCCLSQPLGEPVVPCLPANVTLGILEVSWERVAGIHAPVKVGMGIKTVGRNKSGCA